MQTKIKSISVENVRGISSAKFVFDTPEMLGNKFHLLVAPNGFGKSSLAGAFSSLKPQSLKLPPSLFHKEDEAKKAKIEITYSVDGVETTVKPYIGKHFFHYHPQNCDQAALFKANCLKETWGKSHDFYAYVFEEFRKYRSGAAEADCVAACVAARIAIEKHAFDQLDATNQTRFTEEFKNGTNDKLNFVEQFGGTVPDSHRLLGLLYNDILHHKEHFDYISPIVSKMKNPAIRGMMNDIPLPTSY